MYTSRSTDVPKRVLVSHQSVNRLVINNSYARFGSSDRVAFVANPMFDAATMEVWAALLNGGTCVVIERSAFIDARLFAQALSRKRITAMFLTTALFNQFAEVIPEAFAGLRYLLVGGERCDPESFKKILRAGRPQHL